MFLRDVQDTCNRYVRRTMTLIDGAIQALRLPRVIVPDLLPRGCRGLPATIAARLTPPTTYYYPISPGGGRLKSWRAIR